MAHANCTRQVHCSRTELDEKDYCPACKAAVEEFENAAIRAEQASERSIAMTYGDCGIPYTYRGV